MLNKHFKLLNVTFLLCLAMNPLISIADSITCLGNNKLPEQFEDYFSEIKDPKLLQQSIGKPDEGKLCQGKAYKVSQDVIVHRAWNSTNPASELGKWWAFSTPRGMISDYRKNYEICYQWSPLDRLSTCLLKEGTKVVIGTGQSAQCSQYLTYPSSSRHQIYVDQPNKKILTDCVKSAAIFNWIPYE